ncbi:ArsR/SmtB family transcription factor [Acidicapsa dinghuensis]|uniref:ArsR/SmtB family transcription factor n=1 Tax=Acidicapsa dinghuensis TaxID=2218256 RepID=A0ABW1EHR3_9BACT|nr:metalloregulator ArsR/SmtB family transcription factor [Acidicapsa dinghuensis]
MKAAKAKETDEQISRYADMFSALGTEPRLRIMRLLLSAHPDGMIASDVSREIGLSASNLSHHLEKLKHEGLVNVRREGTFLWYSANADALRELLGFLYAECCTRNKAVEPKAIALCC